MTRIAPVRIVSKTNKQSAESVYGVRLVQSGQLLAAGGWRSVALLTDVEECAMGAVTEFSSRHACDA